MYIYRERGRLSVKRNNTQSVFSAVVGMLFLNLLGALFFILVCMF